MDFLGGLSTIISVVSFTLFAAGVMKIFQMATLLSEIKELLVSVKHNTSAVAPAVAPVTAPILEPTVFPSGQSGEEMLRALTAELDHPVRPAAIELEHKS